MSRRLREFFSPNAWDLTSFVHWAIVLLPTVATPVTGVIANETLMWIIVGTALAFAGTFSGLVSFRMYRFQNDPQHKLKFMRPAVTRIPGAVRIGFEIANDALFPVDIEICELRTTCAARTTPINRPFANRIVELAPSERTFYNDAAIDILNVTDAIMTSRLEVSIKYGHPNKRVFEITKDYDIFIPLNSKLPMEWVAHSP